MVRVGNHALHPLARQNKIVRKECCFMYTREITVKNEVGLHARPATYFIQKANEFKSGIWVEKEERQESAGRAEPGHYEGHHRDADRRRQRRKGSC